MLTRNGIAYNLKTSPYKVEIQYNDDEKIIFRFSSNLYVKKFKSNLKSNRNKINESLSKRFGVEFVDHKLCDLRLYSNIEKRGFFIECKEGSFECLKNIKLNGASKISKN